MRQASRFSATLTLWLWTVLLAAACGRCGRSASPGPGDAGAVLAPAARVGERTGQSWLKRGRSARPLGLEALFVGDALETGPDGSVVILFPDGRRVEMGADARLVIRGNQGTIVLEVPRGLVLARLSGPADGEPTSGPVVSLNILTPFGLTRVGTEAGEVSLAVGPESADVAVRVGRVEFIPKAGAPVEARPGDRIQVSMGGVERLAVEAPLAARVVPTGLVELRKKNAGPWKLVPRQGVLLEVGDVVRVRQGSSTVRLEGSGTRLTGSAGSRFAFGSAKQSGDWDEADLTLDQGPFGVAFDGERKGRIRLGALALEGEQAARVSLLRAGEGYAVEALAGDVKIRSGDKSHDVPAGQRAAIGADGAVTLAPLERPALSIPARPGVKVFHSGARTAALTWNGEGGDYNVTVATDPNFREPVWAGRVHQPWAHVPVPARGALYWRVTSAAGQAVARGNATFLQEVTSRELDRIRNEVPDGAETTTIFFQDKPPAVTFTYAADPKATAYRVQVFEVENLSNRVAELTSSGTAAPLAAGLLGEGHYAWSVTPLSESGAELRGGKMNRLNITYDNSVPAL
ncbi:MAG TPA: hypothetical protein VEY30_01900, partial [Myxococcaceae bacterium]|nr:hypothetical protein [Myxococcaceae bacterium]